MNALSGYTEIKLGGELVPFKFGTTCWALFCELHSIEFGDISKSGVFGKIEGDKVSPPDLLVLRDLYYCAYQAAMRSKGEPVKFNSSFLSDLLDEERGAILHLQKVMLTAKVMGYTFTELAEENKKKSQSR